MNTGEMGSSMLSARFSLWSSSKFVAIHPTMLQWLMLSDIRCSLRYHFTRNRDMGCARSSKSTLGSRNISCRHGWYVVSCSMSRTRSYPRMRIRW